MSPNVISKKNKVKNMIDNKEFIKITKELKKVKEFVEKNFEFVGDKFPREVREIYYDNKKNKNIYGTVSLKEKEDLEDEGIKLDSIPWIEDKEN